METCYKEKPENMHTSDESGCLYCGKEKPQYLEGECLENRTAFCSDDCSRLHNRKTYPAEYLMAHGFPQRYINCSFDNYEVSPENKKAVDKLKSIEVLTESVFITGSVGSGKTHLTAALVSKISLTQMDAPLFRSAYQIINELKASFEKIQENELFVLNKYTRGHILIIDDIGIERLSDYAIQSWYTIIDSRYAHCFPTIITSNLSLEDVSKKIGDRIASRLASGIVIKLTGDDYRLKV